MAKHKWLGPMEEGEGPGGPKWSCTWPQMLAAVAVSVVLLLAVVILAVQVSRGHPGVQEQCGNRTWLVQQHLTRLQDTLEDTKGLLAASNRTAVRGAPPRAPWVQTPTPLPHLFTWEGVGIQTPGEANLGRCWCGEIGTTLGAALPGTQSPLGTAWGMRGLGTLHGTKVGAPETPPGLCGRARNSLEQ